VKYAKKLSRIRKIAGDIVKKNVAAGKAGGPPPELIILSLDMI